MVTQSSHPELSLQRKTSALRVMKDSVLCSNRQLNLQTGRIGIIQELRQTIQTETSLPVQQHIPFRTWEMGLEPESTMNTDHPEAVKTDLFTCCCSQVQGCRLSMGPLGRNKLYWGVRVDTEIRIDGSVSPGKEPPFGGPA